MQRPEFSDYKKILEEKARELSHNFSLDRFAVERTPEVTEEAQIMAELDTAILTGNQKMAMMAQISDALHRIAAGAYGECLQCGEAISARRLRALPWASLCIRCQEMSDAEDGAQQSSDRHTRSSFVQLATGDSVKHAA